MATTNVAHLQKSYHDEAYKLISKGLDMDETNPKEAINCYRKGISILKQALALKIPSYQRDAETLKSKMTTTLAQVEDRLHDLEDRENKQNQNDIVQSNTDSGYSIFSALTKFTDMACGKPLSPKSQAALTASSNTPTPSTSSSSSLSKSDERPKTPTKSRPNIKPTTRSSTTTTSSSASTIKSPPIKRSLSSSTSSAVTPKEKVVTPRASAPALSRKSEVSISSPMKKTTSSTTSSRPTSAVTKPGQKATSTTTSSKQQSEALKGVDPKLQEHILNEVVDRSPSISWDDIAGLDNAKQTLMEMVFLPNLRPELFTGLRSPPKGLLLFGPPGNGKTLLAKAVASEAKATFFSISASSLTSKFLGESEKLVRALFAVARYLQPSIIFVDEIDSLLSARSSNEHEASRRLKTEFLIWLDGVNSGSEDKIVVLGATNRPQELDEAVRRRMVKRIYIPLPNHKTRENVIEKLLKNQTHSLTSRQISSLANATEGYSASDLTALCREAALVAIRELLGVSIKDISAATVRAINMKDFEVSMGQIRPSVSKESLKDYEEWNKLYGSLSI